MSGQAYGCDTCGHAVEWHTNKNTRGPFKASCNAPDCECKDFEYRTRREIVEVRR